MSKLTIEIDSDKQEMSFKANDIPVDLGDFAISKYTYTDVDGKEQTSIYLSVEDISFAHNIKGNKTTEIEKTHNVAKEVHKVFQRVIAATALANAIKMKQPIKVCPIDDLIPHVDNTPDPNNDSGEY